MVIANFEKMLGYGFDNEYEYKNHKWINTKLNCGCITAVCLDVCLDNNDRDELTEKFNKISSLQTLIRETINTEHTEKFMKELGETQNLLSQFIVAKRKQYDFPAGTDCNNEYYYLKLKKDPICNG